MCKWVVNQDKDRIVKIEENEFKFVIVYNEEVYIGCNLMYDGVLLGTFNNLEEVLVELKNIYKADFLYLIKEI